MKGSETINKYTIIRNISIMCICCSMLYFVFPFPPIVWRLTFILLAFIAIKDRWGNLTQFEKMVLFFWVINIIYFFISYLWVDKPKLTNIGNISCTLLSIPLFITLGKKGVMTSRFYIISCIILVISSILYYEYSRSKIISIMDTDTINITINSSGVFLLLLPYIFCFKKNILKFGLLIVCIYYILEGAKRGNIICSIPVLLCYIYITLKNNKIKIYTKFIFIIVILIISIWTYKSIIKNDYLLYRIEETIDGNSSNRDIIYKDCWGVWISSEKIRNVLFGYGFDGTRLHPQIQTEAHNDWLEILVDYGIFGVILYLNIFISFIRILLNIKDIIRKYTAISIISVWFLKSLFSMGFTSNLMYIMFIMLGFVFDTSDNNLINNNEYKKNIVCN